MTTAPSHPPVRSYDGESPYDLVESKWGHIERWRAQALSTGEVGALADLSKQMRVDAVAAIDDLEARSAALDAREQELTARELVLNAATNKIVDFIGQAALFLDRQEKLRADQQEEPLASPPGSANDPSEPKSKDPEPALEPEGQGDTIAGTSPGDPSSPLPVTLDQAEFPDPQLPHPPAQQQPIAAGLDKE